MNILRRIRLASVVAALVVAAGYGFAQTAPESILDYINQSWSTLTRSNSGIAKAAVDPKFHPLPNGRWPVYISKTENVRDVEEQLGATMKPEDFKKIEVRPLPENISDSPDQGLLYLPHPYVVPGGRFNEMYGWDSFFIQVGLLRDGKIDLAKDMADNFVYEIQHYGRILNANRSYYLSRSQPPFFTQMLLGVYAKTHDRQWLENAATAIDSYYTFWTSEPHLTPDTGLSRYFDLGDGPAREVVSAEHNAAGLTHYDLVKKFFQTHKIADYDVSQYYDRRTRQLTPLFYKGDRSMRESGFDPSNRFGAFNIDVIHFDPVCLNTLLYLMETQTAEILTILGREGETETWRKRAQVRALLINRLMWDAQDGLYYDYNFDKQRVRRYPFLTTFYPLWAGIASKDQAAKVVGNLPKFEREGGLQTSTYQSGNQWDSPFGWAPLQMIAVEGLRRYGFQDEADRITMKWLSLVQQQFRARGTIVEKYDVVTRGSNVSSNIHFGYSSNEIGFGWTNSVFTTLYDELPSDKQTLLLSRTMAAHP